MFDTFPSAIMHFFLMLCVPIITILMELHNPTGTLHELLLIQSVVLLYGYFEFLREHKKVGVRVTIETYIAIVSVFVLLFGALYYYMLSYRNIAENVAEYSKWELMLPALMFVPIIVEGIEVVATMIIDFKKRTKKEDDSQPRVNRKRTGALPKSAGCV